MNPLVIISVMQKILLAMHFPDIILTTFITEVLLGKYLGKFPTEELLPGASTPAQILRKV